MELTLRVVVHKVRYELEAELNATVLGFFVESELEVLKVTDPSVLVVVDGVIFNPIGGIQRQWHLVKLPAKLRYLAHTVQCRATKILKIETRAGLRIQKQQASVVLVNCIGLTGHIEGVARRQLL